MKSKIANQRAQYGFRKCFVSAPFGCDVSAVLKILNELGVHSRRLDSLRPGKSITSAIKNELQRSDFVCVVLAQGYNTASNIYELGMAVGLGKPTIILAEPDVAVPVDIAEWPFGRISIEKPDTIRVAVSSLLQSLERHVRESSVKAHSPSMADERCGPPSLKIERTPIQVFNKDEALSELEIIRAAGPNERAQKFERFVASLFERAGIQVALENGQQDRGIDLAFWLDDVSRIITNPILAEIKTRIDEHSWTKLTEQLIRYLMAAGAQCGVLISLEPSPPNVPRFTRSLPMVLNLSAEELVSLLAKKELGNHEQYEEQSKGVVPKTTRRVAGRFESPV